MTFLIVLNIISTSIERINNKVSSIIINNEKTLKQLEKSYGLSNYLGVFQRYENKYFDLYQSLEKHSPKNVLLSYEQSINNFDSRIDNAYRNMLINKELNVNLLSKKIRKELVLEQINKKEVEVNNLLNTINTSVVHLLELNDKKLQGLIEKAIILNPLNLMSKGYSITYQNGKVASSIDNIDPNLSIEVRMQDGKLIADINQIIKNNK